MENEAMLEIEKLIDSKIKELFGGEFSEVKALISPSIGIKLQEKYLKSDFFITSKIGGWPNIDENFEWPQYEQNPLTFLCQLNLKDVIGLNEQLPPEGILYFFIAPSLSEDYPTLKKAIKVVYEKENVIKPVLRNKFIVPLDEFGITFYKHYTLPSYQEENRLTSKLAIEIADGLDELEEYISEITYGDNNFTKHHMFGDPNAVQGAVRMYWGADLLHPEDIYYESMFKYLNEAVEIGRDFTLLLQIDLEDERIRLPNYSDNRLYFGITKNDLKKRDFSNVDLVIQKT